MEEFLLGSGKHYIYISPQGEYLMYIQAHSEVCITSHRWTKRIGHAKVFHSPLGENYEKALAKKLGGELVRREVELHIVGDVITIPCESQ
jgi:type 1 glutamine amidotransferase